MAATRRKRKPLTEHQIAQLSNSEIAEMSPFQLAELIEAVEAYTPQPDWVSSIGDCDEETLLRMAYCARECCRHVVASEEEHKELRSLSSECSCRCPHCG